MGYVRHVGENIQSRRWNSLPFLLKNSSVIKKQKKQKEREKKEHEMQSRKNLANMRVVQKNLVYVIGLSPRVANEETLKQPEFFGQYGKISKIVINRRNPAATSSTTPGVVPQPSIGVYITYFRKEDAARAIAAVDGTVVDGKILRASYGTTKYCTNYLRNMPCQNPGCMYLHEPGEEADSYTKEDLSSLKHHPKDHHQVADPSARPMLSGRHSSSASGPISSPIVPRRSATLDSPNLERLGRHLPGQEEKHDSEGSALPPTASWAKQVGSGSNPSTPTLNTQDFPGFPLPQRAATPDSSRGRIRSETKQKTTATTSHRRYPSNGSAVSNETSKSSNGEAASNEDQAAEEKRTETTSPSSPLSPQQSQKQAMPPSPVKKTREDSAQASLSSAPSEDLAVVLSKYVFGEDIDQQNEITTSSAAATASDGILSREALVNLSFGNQLAELAASAAQLLAGAMDQFLLHVVLAARLPSTSYNGIFDPFTTDSFGEKHGYGNGSVRGGSRWISSSSTNIGNQTQSPASVYSTQPASAAAAAAIFDPFREQDSHVQQQQQHSQQLKRDGGIGFGGERSRFGFAQDSAPAGSASGFTAALPANAIMSNTAGIKGTQQQEDFRALFPNVDVNFSSGRNPAAGAGMWGEAGVGNNGQQSLASSMVPEQQQLQQNLLLPQHHHLPQSHLQQQIPLQFQQSRDPAGLVKSPPPGLNLNTASSRTGFTTSPNVWPSSTDVPSSTPTADLSEFGLMGIPKQSASAASAHEFFGQFLKKATSENVGGNGNGNAVGNANGYSGAQGIPFQDPAIMSVRMSQMSNKPQQGLFDSITASTASAGGDFGGFSPAAGFRNDMAGGFPTSSSVMANHVRDRSGGERWIGEPMNATIIEPSNAQMQPIHLPLRQQLRQVSANEPKSEGEHEENEAEPEPEPEEEEQKHSGHEGKPEQMSFDSTSPGSQQLSSQTRSGKKKRRSAAKQQQANVGGVWDGRQPSLSSWEGVADQQHSMGIVEALEREVANARREAEMVEMRLRAVIEKNRQIFL
ncbi:uncharacterized protein VTP21DRAFT_11448 [Calcarisporiella thermophila]|uniref:uncharacterized protein n=1 Tax=Calcarisporiella thermophila TaxID=911321 RepID=UPI00374238BF